MKPGREGFSGGMEIIARFRANHLVLLEAKNGVFSG
jgi:hypothetical protein